ncbi:MAG: YjbQ family protein [Candidatus Methanomethylicota archaeon]|uniref:YjbQ family protein n=1 Tax=Thermoproteota archaeon TaxID=2056631 RepID=A0A497EUQ7_9CREN|nr:MAG: YjbQ family protein [Candidatus Verstraetearchaeota archaeon]
MRVETAYLEVRSRGEGDVIDLTAQLQEVLAQAGLKNGVLTLFVPGSTGAVTTIEYEPGLVIDIRNTLERIAPKGAVYEHEKRWHDGNGHSHVRASLIGPSLSIPFIDGRLTLGTWQQVIFIELDIRPRHRKLIVQMMGE